MVFYIPNCTKLSKNKQKRSAFPALLQINFVRMQRQTQFIPQEVAYNRYLIPEKGFALMYDKEIVHKTPVVFTAQRLFNKNIQLVHIDITEELRREVANG